MISFDEAQALLTGCADPLPGEEVPLGEAAGRVLAGELVARLGSPRVDVSGMDGYAVLDAAIRSGELRIVGESYPGAGFNGQVAAGEAVRIFTGAPVPSGADRVVIQENVVRDGERARIVAPYGAARYIRQAESDFAAGEILVPAGTRLTPRAMLGAAAADKAAVRVARRPRVAIIGTGDELEEPGSAHLTRAAIPESVTFAVAAMVEDAGGMVIYRRRLKDDLPILRSVAAEALNLADLVVVTGGASVGDKDFAKPMFAEAGLELIFAKVAIKPGKPVWLGRAGGRLVLGLPGNPTSAVVTARLFLRPLLAVLLGERDPPPLRWRKLPLAAALTETGDRETFVRATWLDAGLAPVPNQDSGAQKALLDADWLIRLPSGSGALSPGDVVTAIDF